MYNREFDTVKHSSGDDMLFQGNVDNDEIKYNDIPGLVLATYVRLVPVTWNEAICLRWELHGYRAHIWTDGIYNANSHSWLWSTTGTNITYDNWNANHDSAPVDDNCVFSRLNLWMRANERCDLRRPFVCEYPSGGINECSRAPCQNGGRCVNLAAGYRCICDDLYIGDHCETPISATFG